MKNKLTRRDLAEGNLFWFSDSSRVMKVVCSGYGNTQFRIDDIPEISQYIESKFITPIPLTVEILNNIQNIETALDSLPKILEVDYDFYFKGLTLYILTSPKTSHKIKTFKSVHGLQNYFRVMADVELDIKF